ncbi:uncharacterized protein EV420DRAFT_195813 [Desarmillaria tabescens]|uniref:Uncharacterized protein n=1 Tax=Armillaria tabescens TaxID=1929756 RepID=A0AA39N982_ARMTA|nr:uncharacterized protein EV420DRAFT_195813 [Desarmillaria tabescens]KAK0461376.1 hypothetical protein EV420DRAFT_195813 [Desarmillaria tabescens]
MQSISYQDFESTPFTPTSFSSPRSSFSSPLSAAERSWHASSPHRSRSTPRDLGMPHLRDEDITADMLLEDTCKRFSSATMAESEDQNAGFCSVDLRQPPIDPRRSRRRCMNFGFGREELHPTTPSPVQTKSQHEERDDTSSSVSTPLGTFTGTESDFSSLKDIELEFPQPPPIGPIIRRMQSSPSFAECSHAFSEHYTTVNAHSFRHTSSWSRTVSERQLDTSHEVSLSSTFQTTGGRTDGLSKELGAGIDHESLILNAVNTSCAARWQKNHRASKPSDPHLPIAHARPQSRDSHATPKGGLPHEQNHTKPASAPTHNRMPRIIRRVVSLTTSPKNEHSSPPPSRTIHKMRSLKFVPFSESQYCTESERSKPPPKCQLRGRSISMEFQKGRPSAHGRSLFTLSSSNVKQKPSHKSNLSLPLAGLGPSAGSQADSNPLISKRPATQVWHCPVVQDTDNSGVGLTSFMDITPEHKPHHKSAHAVGRDRVRALWQKASHGILGWGKTLRKKT